MIQRCYYPVTKETLLSIQLPMFSTGLSLSSYSSPFAVWFTIPGETTATNKASRESRPLPDLFGKSTTCDVMKEMSTTYKQSKPISNRYPISIVTRPCWIDTGALKNSWLVSHRDNSVFQPQNAGLWLVESERKRERQEGRRKKTTLLNRL